MLDPMAIELMLAKPSKPFHQEGWVFELKYDGYRILLARKQDSVRLVTRNRKDASAWYPELGSVALQLNSVDFILDGEVCVLDEYGRPDFEQLRNRSVYRRRAAGTSPVVYFAFDVLWKDGEDLRSRPLRERKLHLVELLPGGPATLMYVQLFDDGLWLDEQSVALGLEGTVAKRADSPIRWRI